MTSMPREWRVALAGAGHIATAHLAALARVPGANVIGVADVDAIRARTLADRHAIPAAVADIAQLLALEPDVVHVLTPPASHAAIALAALAAGSHVYVEKPVATSVEDCDRLQAAADKAGRVVGVSHSLLRDPIVERAFALIERGAIGRLRAVHYHRQQPVYDYAGGPIPWTLADGGGPFRDVGVHGLYLIEALLGPVAHAKTHVRSVEGRALLHCDDWHVVVHCEQGTGFLHLGWHASPPQSLLTVTGEHGVLRADLFGMSVTTRRMRPLPAHALRVVNAVTEAASTAAQVLGNTARAATGRVRRYHGVQALVEEFYRSLAAGIRPAADVRSARSVVRWTEQIASIGDDTKRRWMASFPAPTASRVLVTGAMGLIGSPLVERLLADGEPVRVLVRREPPTSWRNNPRVEIVVGDLGDRDTVDRAVSGVGTIFHLGAAMRGPESDFECTVAGTRNIVDAALAHRVKRLVHVSSLAVLHAAAARANRTIREDWPLEPNARARGVYTRTKLSEELIVSDAARTRGVSAVILRPGEVVGRDGPVLTAGIGLRIGRHVATLGRGLNLLPVVAVDDVVDALILAAQTTARSGSIFHLVDPDPVTQRDLAASYLAARRTGGRVVMLPAAILYALAVGIEGLSWLLNRPAPFSRYRVKSLLAERRFDGTAARDQLGWTPRVGVRSILGGRPPAGAVLAARDARSSG